VLAESGIDALSYAALHPEEATRYASTGGAMNFSQPALIASAIDKLGQGARIVIATDNDPGGHALADQIDALARDSGRADLAVSRDLPEREGQDWNDVGSRQRFARKWAISPKNILQGRLRTSVGCGE
jgi:hypothetical protein